MKEKKQSFVIYLKMYYKLIMKCHNYTLQPNPRHGEEETQSTKDTQQQETIKARVSSSAR